MRGIADYEGLDRRSLLGCFLERRSLFVGMDRRSLGLLESQ
ncbi:MAG: hypothetical protein WCP16_03965 [Pseudanabaena sp. ELA645]